MVERSPQSVYLQLQYLDSIRILELTRVHQQDALFCARLIHTRLDESPDYVALSYSWGKASPDDPIL
jgi:hypothetical protein